MIDTDSILLIDTLKFLLKKEGLTYKDVGDKLKLSEISIKRIFSKYDCSLSKIVAICNILNTSLLDVSELAIKNSKNQNYFLSEKQEVYFSKKPFHFYFFRELYRGRSIENLEKELKLNTEKIFFILRKLESIELLEVYPKNKIKFIISGQLRFNLNGVLFNKLVKVQNQQFLESVYKNVNQNKCCMQSSELQLSKTSLSSMVQDINLLGKKYREKAFHEQSTLPSAELSDVRWLFAFLPYKTDWALYQ
jgi:transcriptional regulator with XRE-family HTH domain